MFGKLTVVLVLAVAHSACGDPAVDNDWYDPARDWFTFANTGQFATRHLELGLSVDFSRQVLQGQVILHLERQDSGASRVLLDSRGLRVKRIQALAKNGQGKRAQIPDGPVRPGAGRSAANTIP